jgi:hypothetical protein
VQAFVLLFSVQVPRGWWTEHKYAGTWAAYGKGGRPARGGMWPSVTACGCPAEIRGVTPELEREANADGADARAPLAVATRLPVPVLPWKLLRMRGPELPSNEFALPNRGFESVAIWLVSALQRRRSSSRSFFNLRTLHERCRLLTCSFPDCRQATTAYSPLSVATHHTTLLSAALV